MSRFGLLGRLTLILLSALLLMSTVSLVLLRWQETHRPRSAPFLRIRDTAKALDLLAVSPPALWPAELRAGTDRRVHLRLTAAPPRLDGLVHAPRLEAKLRSFAHDALAPAARVYTGASQGPRDAADGVEGFMALAVTPLPDGRVLVATPVMDEHPAPSSPLGVPLGLWMGLCGGVLAALAVAGAAYETRPLRRLAAALDAFDGRHTLTPPLPTGAPDVQLLAASVHAMQGRVATLVREQTLTLGAFSHDLRTLLTRSRLRMAALPESALRNRLEADSDAMRALVEDALAYARDVDTGSRRERLDLADVVAGDIAEREAVDAERTFELRLEDAFVLGDRISLRRLVANLVDNAVKYGGGRVRVTTARRADRVELSVEDDGPGVPQDERRAVLLPYYRREASRSRDTGGVGLGLAISDRIALAHGGGLTLETSELGGACARLWLPVEA